MTEETQDGELPFTPDERAALRRIIKHEDEIRQAAIDYAHMGWFFKVLKNVGLFSSAVLGAAVAWNTFKSGGPPK